MLRYFFVAFILITVGVIALAGFRGQKMTHPPIEVFPDMDHQPKFQPQHRSNFFADGRAARQTVAGTIPSGYSMPKSYYSTGASNLADTTKFPNHPDYYNTGREGDVYGEGIPLPVNEQIMLRGQQRYQINCAICHGDTGEGNGIIKAYGLATIVTLQDARIRTMPDGQIFSVITNGKNTMGAYGPQIAVEDRWAIVAYLRALQKSQGVKLAELPPEKQQELNAAAAK